MKNEATRSNPCGFGILSICVLSVGIGFAQPPQTEWLEGCALERLLITQPLPGLPQIAGSRIFWVDPEQRTLRGFDLEGNLSGAATFEYGKVAEKRFIPPVLPLQGDVVIDGQRAYLSMRGRTHVWDLPTGELVDSISFGRPIRLLKAMEDRLIVVAPGATSMLMISDFDGNALSRFGEKLVKPRNPGNDGFNDFFALDGGDRIIVLFQTYPIYHVYSLDGELIAHGEYELGLHSATSNPAPAEVNQAREVFPSQHQLLSMVKFHEGRIYFVTGDAEAGILDKNFNLTYSRIISDFRRGFVPKVLCIDASRERLLIRERLLGESKQYGRLGYMPIREQP